MMSETHKREICELFSAHKIKQDDEKFRCYIHAVILLHAFTKAQREKDTFGFSDIWSFPLAKALREYLPDEERNRTLIIALAEKIRDTNGYDFIEMIVPNFFPGDPTELFKHLRPQRENGEYYTLFFDLLKVWVVWTVHNSLIRQTYPEKYRNHNSDVLMQLLYEEYENAIEKKYPRTLNYFGQEDMFQIWLRMFGVSPRLNHEMELQGDLTKLLRELRKVKCPDDTIIRYYDLAKEFGGYNIKRVRSLGAYLHAILENQVLEDEAQTIKKSSGKEYFTIDQYLVECYKNWKNTELLDFFRAFYYLDYVKDAEDIITSENALISTRIKALYGTNTSIVVVGANPDLIHQCICDEQAGLGGPFFFVLPSRVMAQTYKRSNREISFGYISEEFDGRLALKQVIIGKKDKKGNIKEFNSEVVSDRYGAAILFARKEFWCHQERLMSQLSTWLLPDAQVSLQVPHSVLTPQFRSELRTSYRCRQVTLMPNNKKSTWLKKQALLLLCPLKENENTDEAIRMVRACKIKADSEDVFVCREPWRVFIPEEKWRSEKSINKLWSTQQSKTEKGASRETKCFSFSQEIHIWYSCSNGRGRYAFYACPNEKQAQKNPLPRGEKLTKSISFRAKDIAAAEQYLEKKLLDSNSLKHIVQGEIGERYRKLPISLKTFWFLNMEALEEKALYTEELMRELFTSQKLSDLRSDQTISLETYQAIMEEDFPDRSRTAMTDLWRQLNLLLNTAVKEKRFIPNPLGDYVQSRMDRDVRLIQMREGLVKRSYTFEEEQKMLRYLRKRLQAHDGIFIGCAISFFTGMGNSEVCALTWGDYQSIQGGAEKQFLVYQYLHPKKGAQRFGSDQKSSYRRIPVVKILADILNRRKKYVKKQLEKQQDMETKNFDQLPIVTMDDVSFSEFCKTVMLKRAKDEMESAADIPPAKGYIIGEDELRKTTDFNEYHSDRFRSNLRYRAAQTCALSKDEISYILGISEMTTFAKHYCDYTNPFAQMVISKKLERWADLHQKSEDSFEIPNAEERTILFAADKSTAVQRQSLSLQKERYGRICVEIDLSVRPDVPTEEGTLNLQIEDAYGAEIQIYSAPERGEKPNG